MLPFNSLCEIRNKKEQSGPDARDVPFNSLCEIPVDKLNETIIKLIELSILFVRFLLHVTAPSADGVETFNSLCEILNFPTTVPCAPVTFQFSL